MSVLANYLAGREARRVEDAAQRQYSMQQWLQQNGGALVSGDKNALSTYAGFDPMGAIDIQSRQQSMEMAKASEGRAQAAAGRAEQQHEWNVEDRAAQMSAQEAAAAAQDIENAVKVGLGLKTAEEWDAYVSQDPDTAGLVGQFDNREALANQYLEVADVLKQRAASDPSKRYKVVGDTLFDLEAENGPAAVGRGAGSTKTVYGPNGEIVYQEGPGQPPKLTVDAAKNTGFLIRTQDANKVLNELEDQGLDFWQQNADKAPLGLGNYMRDPEFQKFDQARRDFVNAILRRESGAVISDAEFDNADKQYFPVPGDSDEVIAQKRRNRENAIEGLRVGSGEGAAYVDNLNAQKGGQKQISQMSQDDLLQLDIESLSDEQQAELDARLKELGY